VRPSPHPDATTRVLLSGVKGIHADHTLAVFVDPYTGKVRGALEQYGSTGALPLRTWIDELHRDLHLGDSGRLYRGTRLHGGHGHEWHGHGSHSGARSDVGLDAVLKTARAEGLSPSAPASARTAAAERAHADRRRDPWARSSWWIAGLS